MRESGREKYGLMEVLGLYIKCNWLDGDLEKEKGAQSEQKTHSLTLLVSCIDPVALASDLYPVKCNQHCVFCPQCIVNADR